MKYVPPVGGADNDPYIDGNPSSGIEGSPVPAAAIEQPMREIGAVIEDSGQVPDSGVLNQLLLGIKKIFQKGGAISSAAGGTADALTGSYVPIIAALTNGMTLCVRAGSANATTTPTFTPANGTISAKAIVKGNGLSLVVGDIAGGGHWVVLKYDQAQDKWVLLNPATGVNSLGFGQTWQNVIANRSYGTTYYNTTPRPIIVAISGNVASSSTGFTAVVSGVAVGGTSVAVGNTATLSFVVPPGGDYVVSNGSAITNPVWSELR